MTNTRTAASVPATAVSNDLSVHYGNAAAQDVYTSWDTCEPSEIMWHKQGNLSGREYATSDLFWLADDHRGMTLETLANITIDTNSVLISRREYTEDGYDFMVLSRFYG
jgi:hypothetical protein